MQNKNYITKEGYEALREELTNLLTKERPILTQTINWAAGNGDRSENGDYIYGKRKLREIDKRIHALTKKLEQAEVVDSSVHRGKDKIYFGATVTILRNEEQEQTIKIVGQDEISPEKNHISWTAPISKLLLSKTAGDRVLFRLDGNEEWVEILEVSYS